MPSPTLSGCSVVKFLNKAETLNFLKSQVLTAKILPLYYFSVEKWLVDRELILEDLKLLEWSINKLVVRSSALCEDSNESSYAGAFKSILNVEGEDALITAIEIVIQSYNSLNQNNLVLIQPQLDNVAVSGVAFGRDPQTLGPYHVINYDDETNSTESITSGQSFNGKCFVLHKYASTSILHDPIITKVVKLLKELEKIYQTDCLDIEFAITKQNILYLFQVRPLILKKTIPFSEEKHAELIERIAYKVHNDIKQHPYLFGNKTIYGVMPDWNPAEIIGIRPRPLALSLYRNLVTDSVWAYQRDNFGYNNLRSFPLLHDFEGLPYIDVRVSFNSFLPKELDPELSEKLVNYYLDRLISQPELHDKVEFEIIYSCYTLDLKSRLKVLEEYGFTYDECNRINRSLVNLTNKIIHNQNGLWRKDLEKIEELKRRRKLLRESNLNPISKMYWLLEDCKRYGTLPFAGLARAGFIAVQILKSCVSSGILSQEEYICFFNSLDTVSTKITQDYATKNLTEFLEIYGHLRPGTYDILSPRYDEKPEMYFANFGKSVQHDMHERNLFALKISQLRLIQEKISKDGLDISVLELFEFIKTAIESREYSKFIFTQNVSDFLVELTDFAKGFGLSKDDCSFLNVNVIEQLYSNCLDPKECLRDSISHGRKCYLNTQSITMPPLIVDSKDVWGFYYPETMPNFITQKRTEGHVVFNDTEKHELSGGIFMIPSADPGYDWIFSYPISGFITQFGGANSHMAIRAGELGIPAVIGAGELKYNQWKTAKRLMIDAANNQVFCL